MTKRWVCIMVMVVSLVYVQVTVVAADERVSPRKPWTIEFSVPMSPSTVNEDNVYVTQSSDNSRVNVQVNLSEDRKKVMVKPLVPYKASETYTIHVSTDVKSAKGIAMQEEVTKSFQVEDGIKYTDQSIEYFQEIAFGSEWGSESLPLRKWEIDPRIKVYGSPTEQDEQAIENTIQDINQLQSQIELTRVEENPNIKVYYVPLNEFDQYVENPKEGNWGLFYYSWEDGYKINQAKILIATDKPSQKGKSHLIREEITQSLGLPRDSYSYPESIFFQEYTTTQGFTELDGTLIQMLYEEEISPGMTPKEAIEVFNKLKP